MEDESTAIIIIYGHPFLKLLYSLLTCWLSVCRDRTRIYMRGKVVRSFFLQYFLKSIDKQ